MSSTSLARFSRACSATRLPALALACGLIALAILVTPHVRRLSLKAGHPGVVQFAPLILVPLVAAPVMLALRER